MMDSALQVLATLATKVETLTHNIYSDCDGRFQKMGTRITRIKFYQR